MTGKAVSRVSRGGGMDNFRSDTDRYTIEDILNLPDGVHKELIDGKVYDMATPSPEHQRIVTGFVWKIKDYIKKKGGDCEVFPAPFGVFLSENEDTFLEPDVSVVCDKNKISKRGCEGAPDWVIEVVSPSSRSMDYLLKLLKYRQSGVRLYWIVDPQGNTVSVYDFQSDTVESYTFADTIPVSIYDDLSIDMPEL